MKNLPVLISYAYAQCFKWDRIRAVSDRLDLIIDCGAFTVHKKGKKICLEEYYDFLSVIDFPIIGYLALDSIGDPIQTFKNFIRMQQDGYDPIPIFTRGDTLEQLEEYYKYSDMVALGGLWAGGENDPGYVKWVMEQGFRGRKTHWLGFAVHHLMLHFKPYSVDAINWKRALLYGHLAVWNGMRFVRTTRKEILSKNMMKSRPDMWNAIRGLGFDPEKLRDEKNWRGVHTYAHEISTASYLRYAKALKKRAGVDFYFVCNAQHELEFLLKLMEGDSNGKS